MSAQNITDKNFESTIKEGLTLVDFWAPWCGPCQMVAPILEELSKEYEGRIKIVKLNTDENPLVPLKYQIQSIPTMMIFKNGEVVRREIGARPKNMIVQFIEEELKK